MVAKKNKAARPGARAKRAKRGAPDTRSVKTVKRTKTSAGRAARSRNAGGPAQSGSSARRPTHEDMSRAIAEQMPGWRMITAPGEPSRRAKSVRDTKQVTPAAGADIKDLKKKFLGSADAMHDEEFIASAEQNVRVARVRAEDGGPVRIVELRGGKLRTVSG